MGQVIKKTDNELILQRRKKIRIKRAILLFMLMTSLFVTLCLKLPYFNIKTIKVSGNKNIPEKEIISLSKVTLDNNIFYINLKYIESNILSNPYIASIKIERKLPSTIQIIVKEREAVFYNNKNNKYFVIDKDGVLLQQRADVKEMKLIKLDGIDYEKTDIGKVSEDKDKRKIDVIRNMGNVIQNNKITSITSIDVSNSVDIKLYSGNILIKIGSPDNIDKKLNKAVNILARKELQGAKGYIDVSFDGNPVFFIEK